MVFFNKTIHKTYFTHVSASTHSYCQPGLHEVRSSYFNSFPLSCEQSPSFDPEVVPTLNCLDKIIFSRQKKRPPVPDMS